MNKRIFFLLLLLIVLGAAAQQSAVPASKNSDHTLEHIFKHPPASARPWVFWYWMQAAVSKAGITADMEAMKKAGIGGAYLMPIGDTLAKPLYQPAARQLTPEWISMVRFAMQEAKRLNLQLAMHVSDGFALAGGPWITPELSMQKIVFTKTVIKGGTTFIGKLEQPQTNQGYYRDIAIYAYPAQYDPAMQQMRPVVTTSKSIAADYLLQDSSRESFRADSVAWIQYSYPAPFTCRAILIKTNGNNYQAHRLLVQVSDDGIHFRIVKRLEPPRHGWQDTDADVTHAIPSTTAKYFRFVYDKAGSEPGAEDLDNAKWKPTLKVSGIHLLAEPCINQYESKNGEVWRVSKRTGSDILPDALCVPSNKLINLTAQVKAGKGDIRLPEGNWVILRMGHTSTGHKNETGGAAKGLECDKFNPAAITLQFKQWFEHIYNEMDPQLAKEVLKVFHVDSWECGSQNWTKDFLDIFKQRRGYDLLPWLPVMAGVPLASAEKSEAVLFDVRQTIAELINDIFYTTLAKLAHEKGCSFSAESVAPTMLSDGMQHYSKSDLPMGEFWLRSPTHDKPNDMLDAISGAHIYGKPIVQSESFTELRQAWDEYPGMLKAIGDRNFALGINKMVFHVFAHNPWTDKQPGYTLDGIGLYYQRNQTWFNQSNAWVDYITRCQSLLQAGRPVADIAVYSGDELPRRSILPNRLVSALPGIIGPDRVMAEQKRLLNTGEPLRTIPDGVTHSANMADPENWVNPLNGYAYDSFNPDALLHLARTENGNIVLTGGARYRLLVLPAHPMNPNRFIAGTSARKILQLVKDGATVLIDTSYHAITQNASLHFVKNSEGVSEAKFGRGKFLLAPYNVTNFNSLQLERDLAVEDNSELRPSEIAYMHRASGNTDIYFISNQLNKKATVLLSFRIKNRRPELWDAVTGRIDTAYDYSMVNGRVQLSYTFDENASVFVVFRRKTNLKTVTTNHNSLVHTKLPVFKNKWMLQFDPALGGPRETIVVDSLPDWSASQDKRIRYYSGTVIYRNHFDADPAAPVSITLMGLHNIATIKINGIDCGTLWTAPYQLDISRALLKGDNLVEIAVTNTWRNRIIGDHDLPEGERIIFTTAPYRLDGKPLLKAGVEKIQFQ